MSVETDRVVNVGGFTEGHRRFLDFHRDAVAAEGGAIALFLSSMEALKVFVSSVMSPSLEDLTEARRIAFEAVESLAPIACAWAFEREPASTKRLRDSYIDEVKTCDLMLLIVGRVVTPAVREEFDTARDHQKPILAFVRNVPQREPGAAEVLALLDAKYDTFTEAPELRDKIRSAVGKEILRRARGESEDTAL